MSENENFDMDALIDELSDRLESMIEDAVSDQVEDAVTSAIEDNLPDALEEALNDWFSNLEFVLKDGTIVRQRPRMSLLYPDKSRLMPCYGGLYVTGTRLMVQIASCSWDGIAFPTKEDALAALEKIKNAINDGVTLLEL